jgi:RES domain-containing protein
MSPGKTRKSVAQAGVLYAIESWRADLNRSSAAATRSKGRRDDRILAQRVASCRFGCTLRPRGRDSGRVQAVPDTGPDGTQLDATSATRRRLAQILAIFATGVTALLLASTGQALSIGQPVRISPEGHTVAEFSAATSPGHPEVMVASAIDNDQAGFKRCAVYVSRDGGTAWSEAAAWPASPILQPSYDPWVAIGADGTIHATCIAATNAGARVVYTQSVDEGASWTPPRAVTPFPAPFHRQSADKSALTVTADGTVYVCFTEILTAPQAPKGLIVARSTDDGLHWTSRDTGGRDMLCNGLVAADNTVTISFYRRLRVLRHSHEYGRR